ncbi:Uncharacterised protein [Bordetella pertussis]|nr:Uncharacterised protein [Bordetella pertussis]
MVEHERKIRPRLRSTVSWICRSPFSISWAARRALSSNCAPSAVNLTCRVVRWKRSTPSCASSCLICPVTAAWDRCDSSAACRKLQCSATSMNVCSSFRLMFGNGRLFSLPMRPAPVAARRLARPRTSIDE